MRTPSTVTAVSLDLDGLTQRCQPVLARFGRRSSRLVVEARHLTTQPDDTGLLFFPIDEVFCRPTTFIGFGMPNTYLVVPSVDQTSQEKLAAFMFWRSAAALVPTKGRVQAGLLYELRHLPDEAEVRLRASLAAAVGSRDASCARQIALTLADAGFRFGDGSALKHIYRPSKFASLLWRRGLQYVTLDGTSQPVDIRVIQATPAGFGDHLVGIWKRELSSPSRAIKKQYQKARAHAPAPRFTTMPLPAYDEDRWQGPTVTVGMARSDALGANLGFAIGQKPVYVVKLPNLMQVPELRTPLTPFPVVEDLATRLKRDVLFAPAVIKRINRSRLAGIDWYSDGLRADMVLDMLKASPGPDYASAVLYNCVVTRDEIRVTGLHTDEARNQASKLVQRLDWIAAKHVLLADYDPTVVFACELWVYSADGRPVLCINHNSGTYRPTAVQMEAFASYVRRTFRIDVRTFDL